ncbi:hypothetical protein UFOVP629_90 [uncultured Caudovirales phage]|uniref:Uncharacterized protein n=1 Tax=uncultured Caudovirales phage TaxID=2100421 RepID=A0A6J5N5J4_9CAUD|nr:hypothetical protein UFOVP629_90 [uncultured Caudovirales phage]
MNIKVKRLALIKSLEKALKKRHDAQTACDKADKAYKVELVAYEAKIVEAIIAGKAKVTSMSTNNWRYTDEVRASIEVIVPKALKAPERTSLYAPSTHQINEIENAIALLNLSDEEFVNASTYKSVSQYIA